MYNNKIRKPAKRAYTSHSDLLEAVREIKLGLGSDSVFDLVLFFASVEYNPMKISAEMKKAFPQAQVVGCTSAGGSFGGRILDKSIVAMGLNQDTIKNFKVEVVDNIKDDIKINKSMQSFESYFGRKNLQDDAEKYVGIILSDGLSMAEEALMSRINQLTEVEFIGGSAADDWKMKNTYLYYEGEVFENAAILMIWEPTLGFKVLKTQSFVPIGKVAKASLVDESKRCLKKIDNVPSGIFYAEQIGCDKDEIEKYFISHAIGIMVYNDAYAHDIKSVDKDYSLYLYSAIPAGSEIQVLQSSDIVESLGNFYVNKIQPLASISAIVNFSCGTRFRKIKREGVTEEVTQILKDLPMVGFGTYGEYYISFLNQTAVLLILF